MKTDLVKNNVAWFARALVVLSIVCVAFTAVQVYAYVTATGRIDEALGVAKASDDPNDAAVKELLGTHKKVADELKRKNMFAPPPARPAPPQCYGIIGQSAIIGDRLYKAGDKFGSGEIVAVGPTDVTLLWDGNEIKLVPFSYAPQGLASGRSRPAPGSEEKKEEPASGSSQVTVVVQPPTGPGFGGPPGGFMGMSPDQRREMIERFRNMSPQEQERYREEMRSRFEGGRGGFRRPGR